MAELEAARKRLGPQDPGSLLCWVLNFAYCDLDALGPGALGDLAMELFAFAQPVLAQPPITLESLSGIYREQMADRESFFNVASVQSGIRVVLDGLGRLLRGDLNPAETVGLTGHLTGSLRPVVERGRLRFQIAAVTLEAGVRVRLADLINAAPRPIRSCLECRKLFLPVKRQGYCSERCGRRARKRRYRDRHRTKANTTRRAAYKRKVEERTGMWVKVGPYTRRA